MKKKVLISIVFIIFPLCGLFSQTPYYYYQGNKIYLYADSSIWHVEFKVFDNESQKEQRNDLLKKFHSKEILPNHYLYVVDSLNRDSFLLKIDQFNDHICSQSPRYWTNDSTLLIPQRTVIIKKKSKIDIARLLDSLNIVYDTLISDSNNLNCCKIT